MKLLKNGDNETSLIGLGDLLLEDFVGAQTSIATVESLKWHAENREQEVLNQISSAPANNKIYVTPQDVPGEQQQPMAHASLDAHFRKVQAGQVEAFSKDELANLNQEAERKYTGKKAIIKILQPELGAVAVLIKDKKSGAKYFNKSKAKTISGIIQSIDLAGNKIVLKPTLVTKIFNNPIQNYSFFVINPSNLEPLIRISISS